MLFLIRSLLIIFLLPGCQLPQGSVKIVFPPDPDEGQRPHARAEKRFQSSVQQGPTAVESAIELSGKYARLSEEIAVLKQKNQDLITENRRLKNQVAPLSAQLQQTQKELTQANDLLIEMRIELNNWKTDILGFRSEMRNADTEQLKALLNILKILGGEVEAESSQRKNAVSAEASPGGPGQPQPQETLALGKPND